MNTSIATTPIYSSLPLTPDTRAVLQAALRGDARPSNAPATVQMHWVVSVVEGIRCLTNQPNANASTRFEQNLRVKQIQYEGRTAYLLKAGRTRSRVILYSHADRIYAVFSNLTDPNPSSPHVPLYEQTDSGTYQMQVQASLARLTADCAEFLSSETKYSSGYTLIPLTAEADGGPGFRYGEIVNVQDEGEWWSLGVMTRRSVRVDVRVAKKYIRYSNVKSGYHLVWKDDEVITQVDVASFNELSAFYSEEGRPPYGGKNPIFYKG